MVWILVRKNGNRWSGIEIGLTPHGTEEEDEREVKKYMQGQVFVMRTDLERGNR
jgi:hypothetical protein